VGILEGHTMTQNHVGTLHLDRPNLSEAESVTEVGRFVWFKPVDKRVPFILIPSQIVPSEILKVKKDWSKNLYTSKITRWEETSVFPLGSFNGHLGQMGELATESEALLAAAGITWEDFSDEVLSSLVPTVV
jgi:exoribonuclease R